MRSHFLRSTAFNGFANFVGPRLIYAKLLIERWKVKKKKMESKNYNGDSSKLTGNEKFSARLYNGRILCIITFMLFINGIKNMIFFSLHCNKVFTIFLIRKKYEL